MYSGGKRTRSVQVEKEIDEATDVKKQLTEITKVLSVLAFTKNRCTNCPLPNELFLTSANMSDECQINMTASRRRLLNMARK